MKQQIKELAKFKFKTNLLVLENICIDNGTMRFGDLESLIIAPTSIKGQGMVLFSEVQKILTKYPDASVELNDVSMEIEYNSKKFKLPAASTDEYPIVPEKGEKIGQINVNKEFLSLEKFLSKDEIRLAMTGVFIGKTHYVATDAHRMRWIEHEGIDHEFILPKTAFKMVQGVYEVYNAGEYVYLEGEYTYVFRKIDARYPDYKVVIREKSPISFSVRTSEFKTLIEDGIMVSNEVTKLVVIDTSENILSASDIDMGKEFKGKFEHSETNGEPIRIGFNGAFMLDILKGIDEQDILLEFDTPSRAIHINVNTLLMPLNLER